MKKSVLVLALVSINFSAVAEETSWLDSVKSFIGMNDSSAKTSDAKSGAAQTEQQAATSTLNSAGLVDMLTSSLNVDKSQAEGGMGAIFNYVKNNLSVEKFTQLAASIPGAENLIGKMPEPSKEASTDSLSGMLDTASQYSDSVKSINDVKKQFEALGLKPEMIGEYISSAQTYLNSPEGKQAKDLFTQGVNKLIGA